MAASEPENRMQFPATHWSLVGRAGGDDAQVRRAALGEVVRQYLPALRAHLVHRRLLRHDRADDVLQAFLATRVLERQLLARADRERGRFRNFLLASLERFVLNSSRHDHALKRQFEAPAPAAGMEGQVARAPADVFEMAWVRHVLRQAVEQMRSDCAASSRTDVWSVFEARILKPALEGAEPLEYDLLVSRYGLSSPREASNLLMTGKRAFVRALRSVIGRYEKEPANVDAEIQDLLRILSGSRA